MESDPPPLIVSQRCSDQDRKPGTSYGTVESDGELTDGGAWTDAGVGLPRLGWERRQTAGVRNGEERGVDLPLPLDFSRAEKKPPPEPHNPL